MKRSTLCFSLVCLSSLPINGTVYADETGFAGGIMLADEPEAAEGQLNPMGQEGSAVESPAAAQENAAEASEEQKRHILAFSLFGLFTVYAIAGFFHASYELRLHRNISVGLSLGRSFIGVLTGGKVRGYWPTDDSDRLYVGFGYLLQLDEDGTNPLTNQKVYTGIVGYEWVLDSGFLFRLGIGALDVSSDVGEAEGPLPIMELGGGITF